MKKLLTLTLAVLMVLALVACGGGGGNGGGTQNDPPANNDPVTTPTQNDPVTTPSGGDNQGGSDPGTNGDPGSGGVPGLATTAYAKFTIVNNTGYPFAVSHIILYDGGLEFNRLFTVSQSDAIEDGGSETFEVPDSPADYSGSIEVRGFAYGSDFNFIIFNSIPDLVSGSTITLLPGFTQGDDGSGIGQVTISEQLPMFG